LGDGRGDPGRSQASAARRNGLGIAGNMEADTAMIENKEDKALTREYRKRKVFLSPNSWISIAGHVYLAGKDASARRAEVFEAEPFCALCKRLLRAGQGDLEHIRGGRPIARCWCYHQKLADGTFCTNVRRTHGMFDQEPCHRQKHNREVHLKRL
jgi:hypothetical protein